VSFTDADLIARVLTREDHNAFGELVRRYQSPVRAFLTRMTRGDAHRADDLAQETFLKAWHKLHTYRGSSRFSTWLFGVAYNEFRGAAKEGSGFVRSARAARRIGAARVRRRQPPAPGFDGGPEPAKFP
jgi:RNA polymerase sigma factor (sigma-70 family)